MLAEYGSNLIKAWNSKIGGRQNVWHVSDVTEIDRIS
jgi:hypothetical protein